MMSKKLLSLLLVNVYLMVIDLVCLSHSPTCSTEVLQSIAHGCRRLASPSTSNESDLLDAAKVSTCLPQVGTTHLT